MNCRLAASMLTLSWFLGISALGVANAQPDPTPTRGTAADGSASRAESGGDGQTVQTLFAQTAIEASAVDERIIGDVAPPKETFCVRIANMGADADAAAITFDVGRYTGFRPAKDTMSQFQRGPRSESREGTAVQMQGTDIGIWIDSDSPRPEKGSLLPVCPAYWWLDETRAPRPFQEPDRELAFSFEMQVPTAERQGQAEVYVCAYFLLRDERTRQALWLGASLFDLRGVDRFPDTVHVDDWEAGTGLPILFTALNERSAWLHPGPDSAHFTARPYAEYRRFEFRVTSAELSAAIRAMKSRWPKFAEVSEEAGNYRLVHFNINPEVHAPIGSRGRLGLAVRDVRVVLIAPK